MERDYLKPKRTASLAGVPAVPPLIGLARPRLGKLGVAVSQTAGNMTIGSGYIASDRCLTTRELTNKTGTNLMGPTGRGRSAIVFAHKARLLSILSFTIPPLGWQLKLGILWARPPIKAIIYICEPYLSAQLFFGFCFCLWRF